jgi:predicted transcriptional regulator
MSHVMSKWERDEKSGRFTDKYPPEDVLAVIDDYGGRATTTEIADGLGSSRDAAYMKLQMMEENNQITSSKAGGIRVWENIDNNEQE